MLSPVLSISQVVPSRCFTTVQTCATGLDGLKGAMLVLPACAVCPIPSTAVTSTTSDSTPDQTCVTDVQQSRSTAGVY